MLQRVRKQQKEKERGRNEKKNWAHTDNTTPPNNKKGRKRLLPYRYSAIDAGISLISVS